ncbi:MAG: DUF1553 domain-containing protein, partial [Planctomycetota bacterium]
AREFVESNWDVNQLLRLLLTSATYRQASKVSPELLSRDPENRLLARGPRVRLSAYAIRDLALDASGLLVDKIGGPSVKPYMPPNVWKAFSNNRYVQDHGAKLYRRSVYTYWRRTIPPPTMMTFNAAEREVCVLRKDKTNTPLQALTMMNNVAFVEASRFLAQSILRAEGDVANRLSATFRRVCSRRPSSRELAVLTRVYEAFLSRYRRDAKAAKALLTTGEGQRDESLSLAEHAAMTLVASMILNLDEAISKE